MNKVKKIATVVFDFFEVWLPMLMFFAVFVLYLMMIGGRLMGTKIGKYFELCQIAFIWCSVLSASRGGRTGSHISFTIIYDKCPEKVQTILRIIAHIVTIAVFLYLIPSSYEAVDFLKIKKSDLCRIPFNLIYAPFMVFIIMTIIHYTVNLVNDVKLMLKRGKEGQ